MPADFFLKSAFTESVTAICRTFLNVNVEKRNLSTNFKKLIHNREGYPQLTLCFYRFRSVKRNRYFVSVTKTRTFYKRFFLNRAVDFSFLAQCGILSVWKTKD